MIEHIQKISKGVEDMNTTINKPDLLDFYRVLFPITAEHMFSVSGTLPRK